MGVKREGFTWLAARAGAVDRVTADGTRRLRFPVIDQFDEGVGTLTIQGRDGVTTRPAGGFTLHIGFRAPDFDRAQLIARELAEGLGRLRRDVDTHSALVSPDGASDQVTAVFCGAVGPDGERCMDEPDHGGAFHDEGGVDSRVWSDHDRPEIRVR